ncbi:(d)CMP kinase [Ornithinimicrobium ciconiae]|uniref:Cytidylate kinase n=1 Tax=Ornithinimicrobium ciconiae TaxID=2594265 RepID=A0A516GAX2_9MICO|nr:(d)CMP kinase [Ornithinimicrobium ciconiae]QDO88676.1 (d)CMP kinase [Ornithinimicrobium ciconiae]
MPENPITIAIDGPSGSGKSSVSKAVARQLGLAYLDTGAMYRALTWWCLERGLDTTDVEAVAAQADTFPLVIGTEPDAATVHVGGTDIGAAIRQTRVSEQVSHIATNLQVRATMRDLQRQIIADARHAGAGIVVEGRDITTVIAPDAEHRFLLSASEEARLARRARELFDTDDDSALAATHDQIVRRDAADSTVSAFFEPAPGVVGIDTSDLTFDQSVAAVLDAVEANAPAGEPVRIPDHGGNR